MEIRTEGGAREGAWHRRVFGRVRAGIGVGALPVASRLGVRAGRSPRILSILAALAAPVVTALALSTGPGGAEALAAQGVAGAGVGGDTLAPPSRWVIPRLSGPVTLDGRPDEAAWLEVEALPLTLYAPVHRGHPRQRTEIRVAHDGTYLYAAGWFWDDDPAGIRINSLYRDRWNGDDAFALYVDAFDDNENAKWFGTTPAGMRFDQLVSDDGATLNASWDAFWDATTRVTDEGWFAEVRIPFSTLGFRSHGGDVTMGLTATRLVSRTGERVTFPDIDPRFEFRQPSQARGVVLRGVESGRPLRVTPYVLAGTGRRTVVDAGNGFVDVRQRPVEVGGDLRYSLTDGFTLDLTVNTDFAQVEADEEQVALDRFDLFFPERRRFFQEGSGIFDFTTGAGGRVFHSRRIGLNDRRERIPVLGGVRGVGRVGGWDVGVLDVQTGSLGSTPSENFGVVRGRRAVLNPFSTVGAILTSRASADAHNVVAGVDADLRVVEDHYLTLKAVQSSDSDDPLAADALDRSHLVARWERRVADGLAYSVWGSRSGGQYRPESGFLPRPDVSEANLLANWFRFADEDSRLRRVWPGALAFSTFRNGDRSLESGQYAAWVQWETKTGGGGWVEPKLFVEDVRAPFRIGGAVDVPAGRYRYADLQVALGMAAGRRVRASLDARAGTFFDGRRQQIIVGPTWNVSRHLELGGSYQFTRLRFAARDQGVDIHLARARIRTALDARASANAFVQYNSTTDRLDLNLRLRYDISEGTDLWIVYDEGLTTDPLDTPGFPRQPRSTARTLIVKYNHTFGF